MKLSGIAKYAPAIMVIIILACAAIHVVHTITEHRTMLTALPLWMRVIFVLLFWGVILLACTACFFLIKRHLKK